MLRPKNKRGFLSILRNIITNDNEQTLLGCKSLNIVLKIPAILALLFHL